MCSALFRVFRLGGEEEKRERRSGIRGREREEGEREKMARRDEEEKRTSHRLSIGIVTEG